MSPIGDIGLEKLNMKSHAQSYILYLAALILLSPFNPIRLWSQTQPGPASAGPQVSSWPANRRSKHLTVRLSPNADVSQYSSIRVGNITYSGPADKLKAGEPSKLESLLRASLARDLATSQMDGKPSSGRTLTLNINITNVKRTHPWINILATAAVFVPVDFGKADVTAQILDPQTGQVIAEMDAEGCGQVYEVIPSFFPLGQSKGALKKAGRSIVREVTRMNWNERPPVVASAGSIPLSF